MKHTPEELLAKIKSRDTHKELASTDAGTIRLSEDLVDILIAKGLITLDDLPTKAKEKINNRKALRAKLV